MSQFERDINLAIQQSLEEERIKQEALSKAQNSNQANATPGNVGATPQGATVIQTSNKLFSFFLFFLFFHFFSFFSFFLFFLFHLFD